MEVVERSIVKLASEEQKNLEKHLELLGETYNLISLLESLYDTLPAVFKFPPNVTKDDDAGHAAGINAHLVLTCRRELTTGALVLLRSYRVDYLFHVRKAIEFSAFAARMARHPAMSRIWLAADLDTEWEKFREKFKKLFPEDDPLLQALKPFHEEACQAMHGSIRAVALFFFRPSTTDPILNIGTFDITSEGLLVAYFLSLIHCHLIILTVFGRILTPYIPKIALWSEQLDQAKGFFEQARAYWGPFVAERTVLSAVQA